ncbi:MAG: hypothetical protein FWE87_04035 [Coriobacteriia bacterium]|nr:hypothetical protein [Coriobacteriia bacterium]
MNPNTRNGVGIGFSAYGALIVALQALPNIIWALFPPTLNSLEGNASSIPFIEYGEHILGVAIVVFLLFLVRKGSEGKVPKNGFSVVAFVAIALYWLCWVLYFYGVQPLLVIYAMVVLPPIAFFCAGAAQKVYLISAVSIAFLVFHLIVALENFPLR